MLLLFDLNVLLCLGEDIKVDLLLFCLCVFFFCIYESVCLLSIGLWRHLCIFSLC